MFRRIEKLIDPFGPFSDTEMPPTTVARFTWHYLKPIRFWLLVMLALSIATGVLESSLYILIGWFVDLLAHSNPATILAEHGGTLLLGVLRDAGDGFRVLRGKRLLRPPVEQLPQDRTRLKP